MVATEEIREGVDVRGSQGERLGVVDTVRTDEISGQPTSFIVKTGFWIFQKNKILSVDTIEQIEDDDNAIVVGISKDEFRGIPELNV